MKKTKLILLYLFITSFIYYSSCKSYEEYINDYDEPIHLSDNFNEWIDNPDKFIVDMSPIGVYNEKDTTDIGKYKNEVFIQRTELVNNMIYSLSDKELINFASSIISDKKYRETFLYSLLDNIFYATEGIVLFSYGGLNEYINITKSTSGVVLNIMNKNYKISSSTIMNTVMIYGEEYILRYGNDDYGLYHIIKRHTSKYYIDHDLIPSPYTYLFLSSDNAYLLDIFNKFSKGKCIRRPANFKNYIRWECKIQDNNNINRLYSIVVDKTTKNVITFYPMNDIPAILVKDINYLKLKK